VLKTGGSVRRIVVFVSATGARPAACTSAEEFRSATEQACAEYGYKPGTRDFSACLQQRTPGRRRNARERGF